MPDTILDDVRELLLGQRGDKRILEQIRRAAQNNEAISVYERNYVAKLRAELLEGRRDRAPGSKPRVSSPLSSASSVSPSRPQRAGGMPVSRPASWGGPAAPAPAHTPPRSGRSLLQSVLVPAPKGGPANRRRIRIIAGIGAAAVLVAVVAAAGAYIVYGPGVLDPGGGGTPTPASWKTTLPLSTDEGSYSTGDIISVAGVLDAAPDARGTVMLSVENPGGTVVWTEDVDAGPDGGFSTLLIAGGFGWDESGTYKLVMRHNQDAVGASFDFEA